MDVMYAVTFTAVMFAIMYSNLFSTYPVQRDNTPLISNLVSALSTANDLNLIDSPPDLNSMLHLPGAYDINVLYSDGRSFGMRIPEKEVITISWPYYNSQPKWVRVSVWKRE